MTALKVKIAGWVLASLDNVEKADKMYDIKQAMNVIKDLISLVDVDNVPKESESAALTSKSLGKAIDKGILG